MISTELLRRYAFFAGFNHDQLVSLSKVADEMSKEAGNFFFLEGEELDSFYIVLEGKVGITINVTDRDVAQPLTNQIIGDLINKDIIVSTVGVGEMFGWSALIPPNKSTANAKAIINCRVARINRHKLQPIINVDCCFGHLLTQKAAQIIRGRLRDMRIESLAFVPA